MKTKCIMLVFGNEISRDFSNVKTIDTRVVPNVGEDISIHKGVYRVKKKIIDYKQVEEYDSDSPERGGEMIYIFI